MLVRDLMATDVVSVDRDASLETAARAMLSAGVGSVLVTVDGTPAGIVTETDALAAGSETGDSFADIDVAAAASAPLVTVQPSITVRAAVERMREADVKKLPVVDGMDLRGIVTLSDIALHVPDLLREAQELEAQREGWESDRLYDGDVAEILRMDR
jgi:CBS domain-containing protein